MGEGTVFSLFVSPDLDKWGYSIPDVGRGGTPSQVLMGEGVPPIPGPDWGVPYLRSGWRDPILLMVYPHPRSGIGTPIKPGWGMPPPPPIRRQITIVSTCYAAGSEHLVFTQEDVLVTTRSMSGYAYIYSIFL